VVSGAGTSALSRTKLALRGELRAEEGYIEFAGQDPGRLGDDVVIVGRTVQSKRAGPRALPLDVDLTLDPGQRFRIVGQGLDAYLRGKVRVQSRPDGTIVAIGTIDAVNGSYRAFGQKLDIERGRLIFDGPIDNPALDVLALRRNLQVEAGVEVTGTARAPQVRLTSRPPVPDAEKLSWLVLGRASPDASSADLALLQAAAAQLVTSDQAVPVHRRIIQGIGLDDIAVRGAAGGTASGQVVAFGKRVSDRLYIEYEQGLTVAANLVRLTFALTRTLSVNATTSQTTSSVGFTYRRAFD
jgi:translocation and assembly module TamB